MLNRGGNMDQEKIGKFILKLRKSKKMTQQELANKLNVTDRAISHWENGRSLPDVALFKPLCEIFNISVNELISGERLSADEIIEKSDENIIKTINDSNIKNKKNKKIIFLIMLLFLIILIIILFKSNAEKINLVNNSDELYDIAIDYMRNEEYEKNHDSKMKDFNVFYSYYGFGIEKKNNYKYAYMWIYSQSYYLEEEESLAISSGASLPCKVTFKDNKLIKIEYPKDGRYYKKSIEEMFPSIIADQVLNFDREENINKLFIDVLNRKNKYYDYLNLDMSKLTIDDISYNDLIFSINIGNRSCIPVQLNIYKNNKYILHTKYEGCKTGLCTSILKYTEFSEGRYNYDIMQIIKHSIDANNMQFTMHNLPEYNIFTGNGYNFITDDDNKYLNEFLKSINVDLSKCAEVDYID